MSNSVKIQRPLRKFIPEDFKVTTWEILKPYFDQSIDYQIQSADDLRQWFKNRSELEAVISEDLAWRYINMTCYTDNQEFNKKYEDFIINIQPQIAPISDRLNKKAAASQFINALALEVGYDIMIRNLKKDIEIFREENVPLFTEISTETQKYAQISGAMSVHVDGKEMTLQQASVILMSPDRAKREEVYYKISERRLKDSETLNNLFTKLIGL
ncbi:MAG: M3 family oligoendopeptidase, partial [Flammeovirgaceae bacterium]|nr:M3 family oligoendopeptidase [Flammeovirgaceae bacterium]